MILDAQFSGSTYDQRLWRAGWFGTGITGPVNSLEDACYSSANVSVRDDLLQLALTGRSAQCGGAKRRFTGAIVSTNPHDGRAGGGFTYRYGVLQALVFLPDFERQRADWPAVATFGQVWPRDGEDDILEITDGLACAHFHNAQAADSGELAGCDQSLRPGWNTVASDWQPGRVTYYYNGVRVGTVTKGVTAAPMYIALVNTVMLGVGPNAAGNVMAVAYVRVWKPA